MSDSNGRPHETMSAGSDPDFGLTPEDLRNATIDFDYTMRPGPTGSGSPRAQKVTDPVSGGSIVSWAELLRQQQQQRMSDSEVTLGSLPEIQIDAVSDKDLVKNLDSGGRAALAAMPPPAPSSSSGRGLLAPVPASLSGQGSLASRLFAHDVTRNDEWVVEIPKGDLNNQSSSVDLMTAARVSDDALNGDSSKNRADDSDVLAHALMADDGSSAVNLGMEPRVSAVLSHVARSVQPASPVPVPARKPPSRPSLKVPKPKPLASWLGGAALGIAATGLGAILWYGGKIPARKAAVSAVQPTIAARVADNPAPDLESLVNTHKKLEQSLQAVAAKLNVEKPDDVAAALDSVIARRKSAEDDFRQAEKQLRMVTTDLSAATSSLDALKTEATGQAKSALAKLQAATARESDARKALAEFTAARKDADETLKLLTEKLKAAKRIGDHPTPEEVVSAFDALLKPAAGSPAADVAAFRVEIERLKVTLDRSRSPAQMLDLWPAMLETASVRESATAALSDADAVAESPASDTKTKAKATAVKGFALLAKGDYSQARVMLHQVRKGNDLADDITWTARLKKAESELSDAALTASRVRQLIDRGDPLEALSRAEKGLKVFSKDAYPSDFARLVAMRGEVLVKLDRLDDAARDAAAAVDGGATAAGYYTAGRVAEKRGQLESAKDSYRKAYSAGPQGAEMKPIRMALARVLARPDADAADLGQADRLADEAIQAGQAEGHLVKARVLYQQKKHTEALQQALQGLSVIAPAEFGDGWDVLVKNHPALSGKTLPGVVATSDKPDPALAERCFANGLRHYYASSYAEAEAEFLTALKHHDQDARFLYFLGLARLPLGKIEAARDDFQQAAALERQGLPDSRTISMYFERIQGTERQMINKFRR